MTNRRAILRRIGALALGAALLTQQHAVADADGLTQAFFRILASTNEAFSAIGTVLGELDTSSVQFAIAVEGVSNGTTSEYEYESTAQVLSDVLVWRADPFAVLAGHYQRQAAILTEHRANLGFDRERYAVSRERLDNCLTYHQEITLLDEQLRELRELGTMLGNASVRFEQASEGMLVASTGAGGRRRLVAETSHRVLTAWLDAYAILIEFPDPFRVVQNDALAYYLTIERQTRPALDRLEDAATALHDHLAAVVLAVEEATAQLEELRAGQRPCRFDGRWSGTCSFAGRATVNAGLELRRRGDAQAGTFSIEGGTEFEVSLRDEIFIYTIPSATFDVEEFQALQILVAVGVRFALVAGDRQHAARFTGMFDNSLTALTGNVGDATDPGYMTCELARGAGD